jgi:hypothetical protein
VLQNILKVHAAFMLRIKVCKMSYFVCVCVCIGSSFWEKMAVVEE